MKIGIKYCGGCNPTYDRKNLINIIIENCPHIIFESLNESTDYDIVLIINGCSRACASHDYIKVDKKIFLNKPKDFESMDL